MNNYEKIYEDEKIIVWHDLKGYDISYQVQNKTNKKIVYYLNGLDDYLVLESQDFLNFIGDELDEEYIRCILEGNAEEYSLLDEIRSLQLEIQNMIEKNEDEKEIIKYINYRLFWLKDVIQKIEN